MCAPCVQHPNRMQRASNTGRAIPYHFCCDDAVPLVTEAEGDPQRRVPTEVFDMERPRETWGASDGLALLQKQYTCGLVGTNHKGVRVEITPQRSQSAKQGGLLSESVGSETGG